MRQPLKRALRSRALRLMQRLRHRCDALQSLYEVAGNFNDRKAGKGCHQLPVTGAQGENSLFTGWLPGANLPPRQDEAGSHAFQIPFEGAADRLVEVVDVEDQAAIRRGIGAE